MASSSDVMRPAHFPQSQTAEVLLQSQLLRARGRSTASQDTLATEADTLSWLEAVTADTVGIVDRVQAFSDFIFDPGVWVAVGGALVRIVLIIIFTSLVIKLIDRLSDRMTKSVEDLPQMNPRRQRKHTSELQSRGHLVCRL